MTRPDPPGVCTCNQLPAGHNDDQCAAAGYQARCLCSHAASLHYRDRKDRPTCGVSVCACPEYREKETA